jgi:hypothetical protein
MIFGADLKKLRATKIRLLSNNPEKVRQLEQSGIRVVRRVACQPARLENFPRLLQTKKVKWAICSKALRIQTHDTDYPAARQFLRPRNSFQVHMIRKALCRDRRACEAEPQSAWSPGTRTAGDRRQKPANHSRKQIVQAWRAGFWKKRIVHPHYDF